MRVVCAILCLMMLAFSVVQLNDPDSLLWMLYYLVPAIWAGLAAWNPEKLNNPVALTLLGLSILTGLALVVMYWPQTPNFWKSEVWWQTETAREGMGVMIGTLVTIIAAVTIRKSKRKPG